MKDPGELKIPVTGEELKRLKDTADRSGLELEDWARRTLLRILEARETREANGER